MKELQKKYKQLNDDIVALDKQIATISARSETHNSRVIEHEAEEAAMETKLTGVIEAMGKGKASEKDLNFAQDAVNGIKGKGKSLKSVQTSINGELEAAKQQKTKKLEALNRIESRILDIIGKEKMEELKTHFMDLYAVYRTSHFIVGDFGFGFHHLMSLLGSYMIEKAGISRIVDKELKNRAKNILRSYL